MSKTEGAMQRNESVPTRKAPESASDLEQTVAEDKLETPGIGNPGVRVGRHQGTATFMERVGDTNRPGKTARSAHEELARRDPYYAGEDVQQLVEDVKSVESVIPGTKAKVPLDFNAATSEISGWSPEVIRQNLRALSARLGIPLLELIEQSAPKATRLVPMLRDPVDALLYGKRGNE